MSQPKLLLDGHLKTLKLPTMRAEYKAIVRQCTQANTSYEDYLQQLARAGGPASHGRSDRAQAQTGRVPAGQGAVELPLRGPPEAQCQTGPGLARCTSIENKLNLILTGPPGVGQTHLAIALGREACKRRYRVKFFTASRLVNTYLEARQDRAILKLEKAIQRCDLIIVDELGYLPLDRTGAEHLFGFFSQCYEQTSLIVTTNLPFADWPGVFANDERLAGALLDRLTHHVQILEIVGDSFRLKASLERAQHQTQG